MHVHPKCWVKMTVFDNARARYDPFSALNVTNLCIGQAGLLCKEVCGSIQANCFLAEEGNSDFTAWMKLLDDKADVYKEQQVGFKGFLSEVFLEANSEHRSRVKEIPPDSGETNVVRAHLGSLYCPISANGKAIGIVKARGNRKGQFSEVDQRMLSALSNMVGVLHENMSRNRIISDADSGRPWDSIDEVRFCSFVVHLVSLRHHKWGELSSTWDKGPNCLISWVRQMRARLCALTKLSQFASFESQR